MEPPPDYEDVVTTNTIPSAPSNACVFQHTAQQASVLFGELEWKEIRQEKKHFYADFEGETSNSSSSAKPREPTGLETERLFDRKVNINPLGNGRTTGGSKKPRRSQKAADFNAGYLEGQKKFSNRVAVHGYSERFQDEEEDCTTVVAKQSSSSQAVSIPEKEFVGNSSRNETLSTNEEANMGRYFNNRISSKNQNRFSFEENKENRHSLETHVVTIQPATSSSPEQNKQSQNKSPPINRSQSLSPGSPRYSNKERKRESYIYNETREIGIHVEAGRIAAKKTYCFVNICFCMSCRCALCSSSCSCTWLHCVPCIAYSVLCCPFWFVCLFCSFINPCWKEILIVTSGALKHLAFSCRSVAGNNCSFTCLADDVEETLWNARRWGCGVEEVDEI